MESLDEFVALGSPDWWLLLVVVGLARACDLGSTYLATPRLVLEGNPIARRLGWRFGIPVNIALSAGFALWPLLAISLSSTSLLVAARNLQSAWIMRSLGEVGYRIWISQRLAEAPRGLPLLCFLGEAVLFGLVGFALLWFSRWQLVPFGIGLGVSGYAVAVALFTSLSLWRARD